MLFPALLPWPAGLSLLLAHPTCSPGSQKSLGSCFPHRVGGRPWGRAWGPMQAPPYWVIPARPSPRLSPAQHGPEGRNKPTSLPPRGVCERLLGVQYTHLYTCAHADPCTHNIPSVAVWRVIWQGRALSPFPILCPHHLWFQNFIYTNALGEQHPQIQVSEDTPGESCGSVGSGKSLTHLPGPQPGCFLWASPPPCVYFLQPPGKPHTHTRSAFGTSHPWPTSGTASTGA